MKKKLMIGLAALALATGIGAAAGIKASVANNAIETKAEDEPVDPSAGFKGGEAFYIVDQISAFAATEDGDGQLRAYFLNADDTQSYLTAPTYTAITTKDSNPVYRIVAPTYTGADGGSWTKLIILRYKVANISDNEVVWDHVHNQSEDERLDLFNGHYNTIYVYGWRSQTVYFEVSWGDVSDYNGPVSGTKMYAEKGSWNQEGRTGLFGIWFWGALEGNSYTAAFTLSNSLKVLGTGDDFSSGLWEFTVPTASTGETVTWHGYNFVELKAGESEFIKGETDLHYSAGLNFGKHNVIKGGDAADYDVGSAKRAGYFATYFLSQTDDICDDEGNTSPSSLATAWSNCSAQFPKVPAAALEFKSATGNEGGTTLEQAVARYDYIIGKYNTKTVTTYTDFAERVAGGKITLLGSNVAIVMAQKQSFPVVVVAATLGFALLGIAGYAFFRKKHQAE